MPVEAGGLGLSGIVGGSSVVGGGGDSGVVGISGMVGVSGGDGVSGVVGVVGVFGAGGVCVVGVGLGFEPIAGEEEFDPPLLQPDCKTKKTHKPAATNREVQRARQC